MTTALTPAHRTYTTTLATCDAEIEAAQRLRHQVFAVEGGALLHPPADGTGRDADEWDARCDHLLVREDTTGDVVGTYRLLPPERAARIGRSYGDTEFDLSRHAPLRPGLVEAGRSCVHRDHRTGAVITALWAGVARYVLDRGATHLAGCASIPLGDGGATAAAVWQAVRARHLAPAGLRVVPHLPYDVDTPAPAERPVLPPLLRAYLKLGARVRGRPAYDPAFGTADLYVLLAVDDIPARVLNRLLGGAR